MAASPGHQIPTKSSLVIRPPIAVLTVATFSPGRDLKRLDYSTRHRPTKARWSSVIPDNGAGFESEEPTSPEVGCMGQVKLKQKLAEASKHRTEKKPPVKGKLSKLRKFIFGSHRRGDCGEGSDVCPKEEGCRAAYPTLGHVKRYASGSYDVKYGDIFGRPQPFVAPSGWLSD